MTTSALRTVRRSGDWLAELATADGSGSHPWLAGTLATCRATTRDLADAVHHLAVVHGGTPGMVALALRGQTEPELVRWIASVAATFEAERALIAALVVAAGPLPSTPGQAATEAALAGQRHALAMLAQSNRAGTPLGAVLALALDWRQLRPFLMVAAERFGVAPPPCRLPLADAVADVADAHAGEPLAARALGFGAQQFLLQQRGLWDLLEARAIARIGCHA